MHSSVSLTNIFARTDYINFSLLIQKHSRLSWLQASPF